MKTKQSEVSEKANARQGGRYAATKKFPVLSLMKLLVKQLAIPLSNQKTVAKWLVIAIRPGCQKTVAKSLVMSKWLALFLFALLSSAQAGESEIRQSLQSKFPNIGKLEHVVKTPYAGLYEVIVNDQLLYTDEQGQYLFDGSVIEVKSRRDMTEERRRQLFAIEFDKLPLDLAVKRVKGNGKRKLAYFSDPNCGFCKRLEKELSKIDNVTLYLFLYPIFQGSDEIVRNVYCAKDPVKAWDGLMLNGIAPVGASCKTPTDKVLALGKKLRVTGTPNLVFGDGMQVPGYLPAEELEKRLGETGKK